MIDKKLRIQHPNYLLTKYQLEIFRQLTDYMNANNLSQSDIAKKLNVSNAYVSQVLNGNFNFTLKKLIELGLMIGKVPSIKFVNSEKFIQTSSKAKRKSLKSKKNLPAQNSITKLAKAS